MKLLCFCFCFLVSGTHLLCTGASVFNTVDEYIGDTQNILYIVKI